MPDFRYPIRSVVVERETEDGSIQRGVEQARYPIGTGKLPDAQVHRDSHSDMEKADK